MIWFSPMMKSMSASVFMSSGMARYTGECSQVNVSPLVTSWLKTWFAEVAQRRVEKARHCGPSPSASDARFWLEKSTAGSP